MSDSVPALAAIDAETPDVMISDVAMPGEDGFSLIAKVRALPELARGQQLELRVATERLRDAGLMGPRASSTKFFAPVSAHFELLPADQPNKVRLRD